MSVSAKFFSNVGEGMDSRKALRIACSVFCVVIGAACGGGSSSSGGGESRFESDMRKYFDRPGDVAFFAREAAQAGVTSIKVMPREFKEEHDFSLCGYAGPAGDPGAILINDFCRDEIHRIMAHEISHIGTDDTCNAGGGGHGDPFWKYFRAMAKRYMTEVPNGGWVNPLASIAQDEQGYIETGTRKCRQ